MWGELQRLFQDRTNVAEVLILSALLYGLLTFLRGTRGEGMLKSVGFLLAMAFIVLRGLAQYFDLARLTLVLDAIFQASVIALVVIFQPELRRGLALKIGEKWFSGDQSAVAVLDEVATAAARLAKSKEGALIAIERKDSLREWVASGTIVDAQVGATMLANLFWPGAPLHDGAVIIQNGRIAAAGCFLPLTDNSELPKSLGTRHRAAVGLSEASDALVIVVSEETGIVSLAEGGRLHRELDRDALLELLDELYTSPDADEPPDDPMGGPPLSGPPTGGPGDMGGGKSTTRLTRRIVTS